VATLSIKIMIKGVAIKKFSLRRKKTINFGKPLKVYENEMKAN